MKKAQPMYDKDCQLAEEAVMPFSLCFVNTKPHEYQGSFYYQ